MAISRYVGNNYLLIFLLLNELEKSWKQALEQPWILWLKTPCVSTTELLNFVVYYVRFKVYNNRKKKVQPPEQGLEPWTLWLKATRSTD